MVQRASGRRVQDVVSEELLPAVGMEATTWTQPMHGDWAPPLDWRDGGFVDELPPLGDGLIAPMGGIWTTVADLARWVTWLDDAYPARDEPDDGPLSRASRREMQTVQRYVGYRTFRGIRCPSGYGYGLRVLDDPELGDVITHSGGVPGYGSNMRWVRGQRTAVIALANSTYAPVTELTARILDLVQQQGFIPDPPTPAGGFVTSVAGQLVALVNALGRHQVRRVVRRQRAARRGLRATPRHGRTVPTDHAGSDRSPERSVRQGSLHRRQGERIEVSFSLAPIQPPRIQDYELNGADRVVSGTQCRRRDPHNPSLRRVPDTVGADDGARHAPSCRVRRYRPGVPGTVTGAGCRWLPSLCRGRCRPRSFAGRFASGGSRRRRLRTAPPRLLQHVGQWRVGRVAERPMDLDSRSMIRHRLLATKCFAIDTTAVNSIPCSIW